MPDSAFIRIGDDAENAPKLSYSIPEPNAYFLKNIIPIAVPIEYFRKEVLQTIEERNKEIKKANQEFAVNEGRRPVTLEDIYLMHKLEQAARSGLIPGVNPIPILDGDIYIDPTGEGTSIATELLLWDNSQRADIPTRNNYRVLPFKAMAGAKIEPINEGGEQRSPSQLLYESGSQLIYNENTYEVNSVDLLRPRKKVVAPQILVIESYQLSNYRGNYGAGGVITTHSLAPGEKNKFSIKKYSKTTETKNDSESILDSNSATASSDFEETFNIESSTKDDALTADLQKSEGGGGGASFLGIGASANYQTTGEWGTRSTREHFAKSVNNSVSKHALRASSKRNVEVNFSSESTLEQGVESSIEREVENINVSRSLNLVFRQMVQEYISVLHLLGIKLAVYDGTKGKFAEYSLYEIDDLLDRYIERPRDREEIKNKILREFYYIFDFEGNPIEFLEKIETVVPDGAPEELGFKDGNAYWRIKKELEGEVAGLPEGLSVKVPGVIIEANSVTMKTGGVVLDTFLGLGEGLDEYSSGLQKESVRSKILENNRNELALAILTTKEGEAVDEMKVQAYEQMFGPKPNCCLCRKEEDK